MTIQVAIHEQSQEEVEGLQMINYKNIMLGILEILEQINLTNECLDRSKN